MTSKKSAGNGKSTGRARKGIAAGPVAAGDGDGRSGRRVQVNLLVDYKAGGTYLFDFCKDLGTGGVFIQTTKPLATGSAIDLTFTIPDSKETLITKGTVIWVQDIVPDREDLTPGMGVQFQAFSNEQRRMLEDFVQRYQTARQTVPAGTGRAGKRAG